MLDVGLTVGARSCKISGVPFANENDDIRGKLLRKTSRRSSTRIRFPRSAARLFGAHCPGEHHFVGPRICYDSRGKSVSHVDSSFWAANRIDAVSSTVSSR